MKAIVSLDKMGVTIARERISFVLVGFLALMLCTTPMFGQSGQGTVKGTVLDATGAVIPGASIKLTNQETGITRQFTSSSVGIYEFPSVRIGPYRLEVEASGFKRYSGTFELQAGQTAVVNPIMEVGSVETVVEVTGAAPVITTEGMEVSDVKDALRIRQLPLNGRFVTNLFQLTPGVEGGGSPRVNGMKVGSAEMLLDGISLVDRFGGGMARVQPGLETIQEFRIETVGSSAANSRPATISLVTKSGTNEFHGSVYETHRNNGAGLRARRRQDGNEASKLIRNEFGVSAGGPIVRDRTFWFASYEGFRNNVASFRREAVATPALWDGDFSQVIDNNSVQTLIYDPLSTSADGTREVFPNLQIPQNRISDFSKTMRSVSAEPTININPFQGSNFEAFYPDVTSINSITFKGDHRFSDSDSLAARFTYSRRKNERFGGRFGAPRLGCDNCFGSGRSDAKLYSQFVRWNHIFSPTFLNEMQLSAHRAPKGSGTLADFTDWPAELGLPNPFSATGWPSIGASPFGWDADNRKDENFTHYQVEDNFTWIKGKHSLKFGFKVRDEHNNVQELQQAQGSHSFGSDWTAQYDPLGDQAVSFTGVGFASLILGNPTFLSNQANRGFFYFEQMEVGTYFHDSWKVSPRVTLELGLRWDKWTAYREKRNRLVNVDLNTYATKFEVVTPKNIAMEQIPGVPDGVLESWAARGLTWTTADSIGFPSNLLPADNNNFGPRIGVAVRLTDRWVMRGGYGEYFWTMPLSQILQTSRSNPPLNLRFTNEIGSLQGTEFNHALKSAPSPNEFVGMADVRIGGIVPISGSARSTMPWDARDWSENRMQSWNFTLERELMRDTNLRLSYIGNHGRDLEQRFEINGRESEWNYQARTGLQRPSNRDLMRLNPDWRFRAANHTGFSNSHSLQAEVERRYSNGLAFQWFYTFNRTLTTNDTGGFTSGNASFTSTDRWLVPENIQLIGAPNLSYDERRRLGYFNSRNIPPHRIRWNGIYDLPFGRGKRYKGDTSRGLDAVIGGWQIATIGDWRSGNWSSVSSSGYLFGDPTLAADERLEFTFAGRSRRLWFQGDFDPTRAADVDQAALQALVPADRSQRVLRPLGTNFDNRLPQTLADGRVRQTPVTDMVSWNPRNFFRGPGAWNVDFSVFKNFTITESVNARFTADFFNFFNHPNDANPSSSTGLQDLSVSANEPRIIQFSLRFQW